VKVHLGIEIHTYIRISGLGRYFSFGGQTSMWSILQANEIKSETVFTERRDSL